MILDYNLIWENLPLYFNGALLTLKVLLISRRWVWYWRCHWR